MSEIKEEEEVTKEVKELEVVQEKEQELTPQEQEKIMLASLKEDYDLTEQEIAEAVKWEGEANKPETGIKTILDAMKFYTNKKLTSSQLMFLVITANSRSNTNYQAAIDYKNQFEQTRKIMETMVMEKHNSLQK